MELDLDNPDLFYGSSPALKDLNNTQVSAQKSVRTVGIYKKKHCCREMQQSMAIKSQQFRDRQVWQLMYNAYSTFGQPKYTAVFI